MIQVVVGCVPILSESFETILTISLFLPIIGMLIMRMYALYERSRKVLALYIAIGVVLVSMACVSTYSSGMST